MNVTINKYISHVFVLICHHFTLSHLQIKTVNRQEFQENLAALIGIVVPIHNPLLPARHVLYCEDKFPRFIGSESVANRSFLSTNLLSLLNNNGIRSLVGWNEFLLVVYFPTQNSQVPDQCCPILLHHHK